MHGNVKWIQFNKNLIKLDWTWIRGAMFDLLERIYFQQQIKSEIMEDFWLIQSNLFQTYINEISKSDYNKKTWVTLSQ